MQAQSKRSPVYSALQRQLATGWNTWNTHSVLSHVLLPEGFALNLGIKKVALRSESYLSNALIGRSGIDVEKVYPGPHAYDGSYTELVLEWQGIKIMVQSAAEGDDLVLLVTPIVSPGQRPLLIVESALLWNRPGMLTLRADVIHARLPHREITVYGSKEIVFDSNIPAQTPYLAMKLDSAVGVSTGRRRSLEEIKALVRRHKAQHVSYLESRESAFVPLQTVMAWDTIYEPVHDRVITTVSRLWNQNRGGFVLFCWDTFFAAYMAAVDNKSLSYANVIEVLGENRKDKFTPNVSQGNGRQSLDRSEPPVGSLVVCEIYKKYRERWFLRQTFDPLLAWNRWWAMHRRNDEGLLSWGSDFYDDPWRDPAVHTAAGAVLESGLDNSPMYDDVPFNAKTNLMELSDVGLTSLYIADCDALSWIANEIGKSVEAAELKQRADILRRHLAGLWNEERGSFLNRRLDTKEWSNRLSPTSFYPLLARAATQRQAERMIKEHLLNPDEFWGEWIIPSIARSDSAFKEQDYWRGRIWAPMNLLVYLGLRNYDCPAVRAEFAKKSERLLLKDWLARGHVHENYNALTGESDGPETSDAHYLMSDPFYSWGGLLGLIRLIEDSKF